MAEQNSNLIQGIVSTEKAKTESDSPLVNPITKNDDSELLKNIIADDETTKGKEQVVSSLLIEEKPKADILLISLKLVFGLLLVSGLASIVFFTSQLTDNFGFTKNIPGLNSADGGKSVIPNLSEDVSKLNEDIIIKQTDLNFYRFLEAKMYIDQISYYGDSFMRNYEVYNSKTASSDSRLKAKTDMNKLEVSLATAFKAAKEKLDNPIHQDLASLEYKQMDEVTFNAAMETLFTDKLVIKFQNAIEDLKAKSAANDASKTILASKDDYKSYSYALLLVQNKPLRDLITKTNFDELTKDKQTANKNLYDLVKNINSIAVSDFSAMQVIKNGRIKWSEIIKEIDQRTMIVDKYYSKDHYDEYGGIRYTSYDFDKDTGKISISGETKRFDAKNFTTIATLIEELNNSDMFSNAEMRSFAKSGSSDDGYKANIQLVTYLKSIFHASPETAQ
ncbi:MAG: hypothetical protein WC269_01185 [Candidatus Gracilibacteria bacterium]|jgi:hypothetical protein